MATLRHSLKKPIFLFLVIIGIGGFWLPQAFDASSPAAKTPHQVHIAFGFHANLYHSFRGDTNDENGFGQDIRVIRHILGTLDRFNRDGVPVRAVWDFDSLFSLEEILPAHAPDIIRDVQRRVAQNNDDVMLMSYNNGLMSAMTDVEFMTSMARAISNDKGSGVRDLFGRVAPVVRPQEMMTTPGNFSRYKALGIDCVSLYYSATPFDAFRAFSRELSPTEAHNPVTYRNPRSGEAIDVLPTYHAGDLVENVSLREWAERLHRLQDDGKIDRDVLIFINFDADAEFWSGTDLPWYLKWLPNTGGLAQLIDSVADLDFVTFSNVTDYLATHPPAGTVRFSQDTADGSFNGYHSWAEKAYASDYWTRIVRNRRSHRTARRVFAIGDAKPVTASLNDLLRGSFETRLRALSTTNFGLASPFLSRQRETAMAALLDRLDWYSDQIDRRVTDRVRELTDGVVPTVLPASGGRLVDTFVAIEPADGGDRHLTFRLPAADSGGRHYSIADTHGSLIAATLEKSDPSADGRTATLTVRVAGEETMPDGVYFLFRDDAPLPAGTARTVSATPRRLENEFIRVELDKTGHVTRVTHNGRVQLDAGSLVPVVVYQGRRLSPAKLSVEVEKSGASGVASLRIHGGWDGPDGRTRAPGWVDYRLRLMAGVPYLFIEGTVRYPDTFRDTLTQADRPIMARKIDAGWEAVAPVELRFSARASNAHPFFIHKRNFLGQEDAYAVDYYRHAPENRNVADINNHITAEYAGVTTGGRGMAVAMNTAVNANFAFCPFTMAYLPETDEFRIRANPFGTYYGRQILPPTRGNRLGYEAVRLSAPQLHSSGPTYNGYRDRFDLMVAFFNGDSLPDPLKRDLIAFARRPVIIGKLAPAHLSPRDDTLLPPAGFLAMPSGNGVVFHWESAGVPGTQYRIRYHAADSAEIKTVCTAAHPLLVAAGDFPTPETAYVATIQAEYPDGLRSPPSREIRFRMAPPADSTLEIPKDFMAKVLWANMTAWIR
ncbi:hypothetical protein [Desulfosarcina ovata]|uniref:Fibronectin type-III domain-containing protein n=1 Tax=Desulfosarcina ovata subsp. ovata TaxID=2752305 RepID=A0A5K8A815_9BACT|nr:hypothetical protein [Desulfosarcina ovata]BBO88675.1 hypothetical protein DSCOOX_18550 [Desulfosarcina ovata subsp. ovata]